MSEIEWGVQYGDTTVQPTISGAHAVNVIAAAREAIKFGRKPRSLEPMRLVSRVNGGEWEPR